MPSSLRAGPFTLHETESAPFRLLEDDWPCIRPLETEGFPLAHLRATPRRLARDVSSIEVTLALRRT